VVIEIFPEPLARKKRKNDVPSAVHRTRNWDRFDSDRIAEFVARTAFQIARPQRNCGQKKEKGTSGEISTRSPIKSA